MRSPVPSKSWGRTSLCNARDGRGQREELWEFPSLAHRSGWEATLDALRVPRRPEQKLTDWREKAPVRPVAFRDPGRLTADRVHLHLEQRVARRLLSRFRAQGFILHDLSRACLVQTADSIPRIVLLGRLCLFGSRAERLHEALTFVTARWTPLSRRRGPLAPYGRDAERFTLDLLKRTLANPGGEPRPEVASRLRETAQQDIAALLPHLERDAADRARRATEALRARGEKEAKELSAALIRQRNRVAEELRRHEAGEVRQRRLFDPKKQERELQANMTAWQRWIVRFEADLAAEPQRIRDFYEVKATRFEPVGLAWLWPDTN